MDAGSDHQIPTRKVHDLKRRKIAAPNRLRLNYTESARMLESRRPSSAIFFSFLRHVPFDLFHSSTCSTNL